MSGYAVQARPERRRVIVGPPHAQPQGLLLAMSRVPSFVDGTPPFVYADDSGCNANQSGYFVWAGYWSTHAFWQAFGGKWNRVLDRDPELPHWHQTDVRAAARKDRDTPFRGLTDAQAKRREVSLARLLFSNRDRIWPLVVRVAHSDIRERVSGKIIVPGALDRSQKRFIRALESPQLVTLFHLSKLVVSLNPGDLPVSIVCEERLDDPFQVYMLEFWREIKRHQPGMGELYFSPGKTRNAPQLQAADMLAWHMNRREEDPRAVDDPVWPLVFGPGHTYDISARDLDAHVRDWCALHPTSDDEEASLEFPPSARSQSAE